MQYISNLLARFLIFYNMDLQIEQFKTMQCISIDESQDVISTSTRFNEIVTLNTDKDIMYLT
jgi:hypothetical protein